MNVLVGLCTLQPWFLIHSALLEVSYICRNRALITSEHTSELADLATIVFNSFSPSRDRLAMPAMAEELENKHTSEIVYLATVVLIYSALGVVSYV